MLLIQALFTSLTHQTVTTLPLYVLFSILPAPHIRTLYPIPFSILRLDSLWILLHIKQLWDAMSWLSLPPGKVSTQLTEPTVNCLLPTTPQTYKTLCQ